MHGMDNCKPKPLCLLFHFFFLLFLGFLFIFDVFFNCFRCRCLGSKKKSAAAAVNAKCFFVQHILRILEFTIGLDLRPKYVQFHVGQVQGEKKTTIASKLPIASRLLRMLDKASSGCSGKKLQCPRSPPVAPLKLTKATGP